VGATVFPRSVYGDTRLVSFLGAPDAAFQYDAIFLSIDNGVVTQVLANDAATSTQTTCGFATGGNLNTDRSLDAVSLPTALITSLKTAAVAKGAFPAESRNVTAADLSGLAVNVNFGRGIYTTTNADATIKDVTRINDCQVELKDGKLRVSSVQAGYNKTVLVNQLSYNASNGAAVLKSNKDFFLVRGYSTPGVSGDIVLTINFYASTPIVTGVLSTDVSGNAAYLNCPRG